MLDANRSDLVRNGNYGNCAELINPNFGFGGTNLCYYDGSPLNLSKEVSDLEKASTNCGMNQILIKVYWKLSFLLDDWF